MKPLEDIYKTDSQWCGAWGDYKPLLESMEYEILLQVDDQDYQGDSRLLLKDGDRYGLLMFGWGSCSGCDALQACESVDEVSELRDKLNDSIVWKSSPAEMAEFLRNRDWKAQFTWYDSGETAEFVEKALGVLEKKS